MLAWGHDGDPRGRTLSQEGEREATGPAGLPVGFTCGLRVGGGSRAGHACVGARPTHGCALPAWWTGHQRPVPALDLFPGSSLCGREDES